MLACPYCQTEYQEYSVVGVLPASEHLTYWLDAVPLAQFSCESCGRYTFMHPDHPEVQRLPRAKPFEKVAENVRTLNVPLPEVGDPELREQFRHGQEDGG